MIRVYDALKNGYLLNKTIDLSSKTMTLDAAKDLLRHTGTVSVQTLSLPQSIIDSLSQDAEGIQLVKATRAKGWDIPLGTHSDIRFKVTGSATSMSFKINGSSYNDQDNVTVTTVGDGWFEYNIPVGTTLTSLVGAFNEKTIIDRIVLGEFMDVSNLTNVNRMCRNTAASVALKFFYDNTTGTSSVTNFERMFSGCNSLTNLNLTNIIQNANTASMFAGATQLTNFKAKYIAETIDFSPCPLNLASAKVILNALQTVTSETLTFSTTTKGYINADSEALALVASARSRGWTIAL